MKREAINCNARYFQTVKLSEDLHPGYIKTPRSQWKGQTTE